MTPARCAECQRTVDFMRSHGYQFTARALNEQPWEVAFMGPDAVFRGSGATLHDAIHAAGSARAAERKSNGN